MKVYAKEHALVQARFRKGVSVLELASRLGVSRQAIYNIEKRRNGISPALCTEIVKVLGVEFDEVFTFEEKDTVI